MVAAVQYGQPVLAGNPRCIVVAIVSVLGNRGELQFGLNQDFINQLVFDSPQLINVVNAQRLKPEIKMPSAQMRWKRSVLS